MTQAGWTLYEPSLHVYQFCYNSNDIFQDFTIMSDTILYNTFMAYCGNKFWANFV